MDNGPRARSAGYSRRSLLRKVTLTAGGMAALGATANRHFASAAETDLAQTKVAQKVVHYQDSPKGALQCDNCLQFEAPSSCKVVDGVIAPSGWCQVYVKKPA
jgi:hypothetical protein